MAVNPARAGMILSARAFWMPTSSKPRASGDDPTTRSIGYGLNRVNPARAGMIPR